MSFDLLVLNGPNLNLLGQREPEHYGAETLDDIARCTGRRAAELGAEFTFLQSDYEAEFIGWIQDSRNRFDGLVVNAGAFTHTSLAILDALQSFDGPIVEVHLSNIFRREEFRHRSYVSQVATGVICGFRGQGYIMGVEALVALLTQNEQTDK